MLLARQVLRRIRDEIEARRAGGERLPAPPKTAIAGPEYFGFNQPEVRLQGRLFVLPGAHWADQRVCDI